ncbi:hypothetical protein CDV31_007846 [Fusarium ambrosium]|uniref:C2H2-type domain-containing protein n=1 Tax=Fusarium ambrosium TaxID=131363 RepID=A0A428U431_9HYPO|nr:hypothetical protein CDV31_007846 [Fusarium ambrosium]
MSPDVETGADPDSTSDTESVRSDDSSQGSTISDSRDFDELLADLKTDIQCLRDLGPLIESPYVERPRQPEDPAPVSLQITWQAYQAYGDRILQRFPQAQADLVDRLAKANLDRFRKIQEEKRENVIKQQQHDEGASRVSGSVKFRDSALGTSLATGSIYAETLMAYGQSEDLTVRVPPLPEGAKSGVPFECLACGRSVSIKNNSTWKKHLWRDLRPWICHDSACNFGNEPFASRQDWIEHLEFDHDFQPAWSSFECPLCHEETGEGKTAIVHHLARHMEEISLAALPSGYDSNNDLEESEDENEDEDNDDKDDGDEYRDEDGHDNGEIVQGKVSEGSQMLDSLADAFSTHDPTDEESVNLEDLWFPVNQPRNSPVNQPNPVNQPRGSPVNEPSPVDTVGISTRDHDLYTKAAPHEDGLYHCPWEGQPSCAHQPQKLKANYEKCVDFHMKPYRCKVVSCEGLRLSSVACLLRHEREAHGMHKSTGDLLCVYEGCERAAPGNGFRRRWNLRDHLKRIHNDF